MPLIDMNRHEWNRRGRSRHPSFQEGGAAVAPFVAQGRYAGEPGATRHEAPRFPQRLAGLRPASHAARLVTFALIGSTGFLPNLVALHLLIADGVASLPAEAVANQFGVAWNFLLVEALLFRDRRLYRRGADRAACFALLANADLVLRIPLIAWLVHHLGTAVLPATALALAVTCTLRFAATEALVYLPRTRRRPSADRIADPSQALSPR